VGCGHDGGCFFFGFLMNDLGSAGGWVIAPLALLVIAAVVLAGWWVSAPARVFWRWVFRGVVVLMLSALALPAAAVLAVRDWVSWLVPLAREVSEGSAASVLVHFGLFALIAGLLVHIRRDLPLWGLVAGLVVLAGLMELVQLWVDGRFASWGDFGVNVLGVVVGVLGVRVWGIFEGRG
jgi:hypothetical protein